MPSGDLADRMARHDRLTDQRAREERKRDKAEQVEQVERTLVAGPARYACLAGRTRDGRVVCSTLDHPALVGQLHSIGRNLQHALTELRFKYACELYKRKLLPTMQEARAYALRAEFVPHGGN